MNGIIDTDQFDYATAPGLIGLARTNDRAKTLLAVLNTGDVHEDDLQLVAALGDAIQTIARAIDPFRSPGAGDELRASLTNGVRMLVTIANDLGGAAEHYRADGDHFRGRLAASLIPTVIDPAITFLDELALAVRACSSHR